MKLFSYLRCSEVIQIKKKLPIVVNCNNLEAEMKRNKISRMDIANYIGCSYRTINSRFCGESQWGFDECVMLRDRFFPEMSLDYLFPYDKGA